MPVPVKFHPIFLGNTLYIALNLHPITNTFSLEVHFHIKYLGLTKLSKLTNLSKKMRSKVRPVLVVWYLTMYRRIFSQCYLATVLVCTLSRW